MGNVTADHHRGRGGRGEEALVEGTAEARARESTRRRRGGDPRGPGRQGRRRWRVTARLPKGSPRASLTFRCH